MRATIDQYRQLTDYLNRIHTMQRPDLTAPTAAMFARGNSGWAKEFVSNLIQGEPERLPEDHQDDSGRAAVYNAAKSLKVTVKSLNFNGEIWACRID